jgi:hypothetical protein
MMERTHNAAFEQGKEAFASVDVRGRAIGVLTRILVNRVIDHVVLLKLLAQAIVDTRLVCIDNRILGALTEAGSKIFLRAFPLISN